jgi:hypothetical protein
MSNKNGQTTKVDKIIAVEKQTLRNAIKAAQRHELAIELITEARQKTHPQADTDGPLLLAQQSGFDLEHARKLIEALCDGLTDNL